MRPCRFEICQDSACGFQLRSYKVRASGQSGAAVQSKRAEYGQKYYEKYAGKRGSVKYTARNKEREIYQYGLYKQFTGVLHQTQPQQFWAAHLQY